MTITTQATTTVHTNGTGPDALDDELKGILDRAFIPPPPPPNPMGTRRTLADLRQVLDARAAQCTKAFLYDCISRGELGCAELLRAVANGDIVYDRASEAWYWWNGLHWEPDQGGNIFSLTGEVLSSVYRQTATQKYAEQLELEQEIGAGKPTDEQKEQLSQLKHERGEAEKQAKSLYKLNYIRNVLVFAGATELLGLIGDEWDARPNLLGVNNAVINLDTGQPVVPDPTQYIRTVAPVNFDPEWTCSLFEKSIFEIFDDNAEIAGYVRRFLGYAMSGTCHEADFHIWHGKKGRNGKEFILDRIRATLGSQLAGPIEPELLLKSKSQRTANSATPALMALQGRRIAWASEINEGRTLDNAAMKQLSGGHIITGRANYGAQVEWKRTHTPIMLTNHKPHVAGGGDDAEWERIKLLEFPISFVTNPDPANPNQRKKDATLGERIDREELPGILNWLIAGCLEWRKSGLQPPQAVQDATTGYRASEDTMGTFIDDRCIAHISAKVEPAKLYQEYKNWCADNGYHAMGSKTFGDKIEDRGFPRGRDGAGRYFSGIGLLATDAQQMRDAGL